MTMIPGGWNKHFTVVVRDGKKHIEPDWDDAVQGGTYGDYPTSGTTEVINGRFQWQWGEINGYHCPTDGFCFSGHFTSSTTAEGQIDFHYACQVVGSYTWQAVKN